MEDTIYIRFYSEEAYPRQQIFKKVNGDIYYGRDHFRLWHSVIVREDKFILEMVLPKEFTFIICDDKNRQIFAGSNKKNEMELPLLRYQSIAEWEQIKSSYSVIPENGFRAALKGRRDSHLGKWLLSMKREDLFGQAALTCDADEWITAFKEQMGEPEILKTFSYCGKEIQIYRILWRHGICRNMWYEYYSGKELVGVQLL